MPTVAAFEDMDDETGIKHLEHRHGDQLKQMMMVFSPEPDRADKPRRFRSGKAPWDIFHGHLHTEDPELGHDHVT